MSGFRKRKCEKSADDGQNPEDHQRKFLADRTDVQLGEIIDIGVDDAPESAGEGTHSCPRVPVETKVRKEEDGIEFPIQTTTH